MNDRGGLDSAGVRTAPIAYLATCHVQASRDARGTFYVDVLHDPFDQAQRTFLFATSATRHIDIQSTRPAVIAIGP